MSLSWRQPHACPVSKCNNPSSQSDTLAGLDKEEAALTVSTAWNLWDLHVKRNWEEMLSHFLQKLPLHFFLGCKRKFNVASTRIYLHPVDLHMNTFTDTANRDLGLDSVSVYRVESNCLHLCCFGESLKFHYVLRVCSLAWLQVCDKCLEETSSRYFCDTVSDSLAARR